MCRLCSLPLTDEKQGECVRLICYGEYQFLANMAWMPKSLCSHELPVVCSRLVLFVDSPPKHTYDHRSFKLYACMPLELACQKLGHSDLYFWNGSQVCYFLCALLACMVKLRAIIFYIVIHLHFGYTQRENNLLKVVVSFFNVQILHFLDSNALCASRYILQWPYCVGFIHLSNLFVIDAK